MTGTWENCVRGDHAVGYLCQTCFAEGTSYPSLCPTANFSASWPAASCCAVHHGASPRPTLYPAPSDCLLPCLEKQKKSLSLKIGSEEGKD